MQEYEMGENVTFMEDMRKAYTIFAYDFKWSDHFEDIEVDGRIV
jgi:hypothetical protein